MKTRVLVAALGNTLMGDDGIGPAVAARLQANFEIPDGVQVRDLGTPGIDLALHIDGVDSLIVLDAMDDGRYPVGTVRVLRGDEIEGSQGGDTHSLDLSASLKLAAKPPKEIILVGVVVERCEFGEKISGKVRPAVEAATKAVADELRRLGVVLK